MKCSLRIQSATKEKVTATVVTVHSHRPVDHELVGFTIVAHVKKTHITPRRGVIVSVDLTDEAVYGAYARMAAGHFDFTVHSAEITPLHEPTIRVPASLLRELRGQLPSTERSRQALIASLTAEKKEENDDD